MNMYQFIKELLSEDDTYNHNYRYSLNDYDKDDKLEKSIKDHFDKAMTFASKYGYKKVKEHIFSIHHVFRLQIKKANNLLSYDIYHDIKKGESTIVAFTILFNDQRFDFDNLNDAYKQFQKLVSENKPDTSTKPDDTSGIVRDASDKFQIFDSQYNTLKDIAKDNGYVIKKYKQKELTLYFKNPNTKHIIYYQITDGVDKYKIKSVTNDVKPIERIFRKLYQANKYVTELLTSKKVKGDKTVKEPLVKDVNSEIDNTDKFNKLFDTIVAYKEANDKGYTRLINFLTGELYKNKDIKNLIDLNYNGDTSQIKNIINNHFTKK